MKNEICLWIEDNIKLYDFLSEKNAENRVKNHLCVVDAGKFEFFFSKTWTVEFIVLNNKYSSYVIGKECLSCGMYLTMFQKLS